MYDLKDWEELQIYNHTNVVAIDFDGVIHKNSKGLHDGTIYDEPVEGAIESIKELSSKYIIIIYSFKGHPDRPLLEGKNGISLVWDWLDKMGIKECVNDVVWGKPNAFIYIDDKGYRFNNWKETKRDIDKYYLELKE